MLINGAMNGEIFWPTLSNAWPRRSSAETLSWLTTFRPIGFLEAVGASLRYLRQYSPDLNPIEMVFHPLKALLRKVTERTIAGLSRRIRSFIPTLHPVQCMEYFRHAGYAPL